MPRQPRTGWENRLGAKVVSVPPDQLLANPLNARRHPGAQRDALRALLDAVGWVAPVTVNTTTGHLLDGHARVEEALTRGAAAVPVVYVTLTEEQERLALAALDPIAALASYDAEVLGMLTAGLGDGVDESLSDLLADLDAVWSTVRPFAQAGDEMDEVGNIHIGQTPTDRQDAYEAAGMRSIVLVYDQVAFEEAESLLASTRQRLGVPTNADVVLHLLRNTERPPRRSRS